jgi:hypothetical protein
VALHELLELPAGALGYVEKGAERPRREQRIAGSPQHARVAWVVVAETPQERGLPDAGLSTHENETPTGAALHGVHGLAQQRKLVAALEQLPRRVQGRRSRCT